MGSAIRRKRIALGVIYGAFIGPVVGGFILAVGSLLYSKMTSGLWDFGWFVYPVLAVCICGIPGAIIGGFYGWLSSTFVERFRTALGVLAGMLTMCLVCFGYLLPSGAHFDYRLLAYFVPALVAGLICSHLFPKDARLSNL